MILDLFWVHFCMCHVVNWVNQKLYLIMTGSVLVLESITPVPCLLFSEYRASELPLDIKEMKFWKGYYQPDHI